MLEVSRRGDEIYAMRMSDIGVSQDEVYARMDVIELHPDADSWFSVKKSVKQPLSALDLIWMRKDPPVDTAYIQATYLLERANEQGARILNRPSSLRDANEKLFTLWFPACCPETCVSASRTTILEFVAQHQEAVIKPLDQMGGRSIFRLKREDSNNAAIIDTVTDYQTRHVMVQRFIPDVMQGDKRVLMINGEPLPYALLRIPKPGDFRGNLAAGASSQGVELTDRDRWICEQVGPTLKEKGLYFVGLDIIGEYLTEINVTSPTGVRELDTYFNTNIAKKIFDSVM